MAAAVVVAANPTDRESKVSGCRNNIHTGEEIDLSVVGEPDRAKKYADLATLVIVGGFCQMFSRILEKLRPKCKIMKKFTEYQRKHYYDKYSYHKIR
jgi:hypothetical protein